MEDCLFCRIARKEIPSEIVYEDEGTLAIKDIHPQAPVHILIIPKEHMSSIMDVSPDSSTLVCNVLSVAKEVAIQQKVDKTGFRVITNHGPDSGQEIDHLHFHLLGGRRLGRLVQRVE
jgi:histidine triad (HIT) family protein